MNKSLGGTNPEDVRSKSRSKGRHVPLKGDKRRQHRKGGASRFDVVRRWEKAWGAPLKIKLSISRTSYEQGRDLGERKAV